MLCWRHKGIWNSTRDIFYNDGVHFSDIGNYHRSLCRKVERTVGCNLKKYDIHPKERFPSGHMADGQPSALGTGRHPGNETSVGLPGEQNLYLAIHLCNYSNAACHIKKYDVIVSVGMQFITYYTFMHFLSTSVYNCIILTQLPDCCFASNCIILCKSAPHNIVYVSCLCRIKLNSKKKHILSLRMTHNLPRYSALYIYIYMYNHLLF